MAATAALGLVLVVPLVPAEAIGAGIDTETGVAWASCLDNLACLNWRAAVGNPVHELSSMAWLRAW